MAKALWDVTPELLVVTSLAWREKWDWDPERSGRHNWGLGWKESHSVLSISCLWHPWSISNFLAYPSVLWRTYSNVSICLFSFALGNLVWVPLTCNKNFQGNTAVNTKIFISSIISRFSSSWIQHTLSTFCPSIVKVQGGLPIWGSVWQSLHYVPPVMNQSLNVQIIPNLFLFHFGIQKHNRYFKFWV